ncbi:MAG TPA: TerB family tellurite resistance protein [Sphingomicrobium sp.]|nr:TerB family tellurite resistance protein [Sphingomicrobium sp.]
MIKRLFEQIAAALSQPDSAVRDAEARERAIRRATAVLMLDVALADKVFDEREREHLRELAAAQFGLSKDEAAELIASAREEAEEMVSLHEFTQFLHNNLSHDEKAGIVGMLWQIAYTDGALDKYENALVLKISDLLYVSRGRVMRLKHDAAEAAAEGAGH